MGQDMFFPKRGGGQRRAKKICEACTVREECRDYARRTNTHYGIWGGEVLKRWGDEPDLDDEEISTAIPPASVPAASPAASERVFALTPSASERVFDFASSPVEIEVHAIDCDLDEDCSCYVTFPESAEPIDVVKFPARKPANASQRVIAVRDLPLCPPDDPAPGDVPEITPAIRVDSRDQAPTTPVEPHVEPKTVHLPVTPPD